MRVPVVTTHEADATIRAIDEWWRINRAAAPNLFSEELASCFELLSRAPQIGRIYRHKRVRGVRRILLRATRYHVYYVYQAERSIILAVWHSMRGSGPPLLLPSQ